MSSIISSIKITSLTNIGNNISHTSIFPLVNMAGTPITQRANLQILGNLILDGAGGSYFRAAAQAINAQTVSNATQPAITSVGTLTGLTVQGVTNLGSVSNVIITGGDPGQVLSTNGEGFLTWQTGGGGAVGATGATGPIGLTGATGPGGEADTGDITFDGSTISAPDGTGITVETKDEDGFVNTGLVFDAEYAAVKLSAKSLDSKQFYEGESQDYATGTWTTANGSATLSLTGATRFLDFINDDSEWRQAGDRETGEFSLDGIVWYQWPYSSSSSGPGQISVNFSDPSFTAGDPISIESFYLRWTNESYITVDQDDYSEVKIVGAGVGVNIKSTSNVNTEAGDSINFEAQRSISLQTIDEQVRIETSIYDSRKTWEFGVDGTLKMPDTGELAFYRGGTEEGRIIPGTSDGGGLQVDANVDFEIKVTQGDGEEEETAIWSFEPNGDLVFPDSTIQTTAYTGGGSADTGDITFDSTTISAPDNATIVVAAQDGAGVTTARLTVDPSNKLAKLESSIDADQSFFAGNEYSAAQWTVNQSGDGVLVFSDASELFEFIDGSNTAWGRGSNRTLSWNEGDQRVEYFGNYAWNGEINQLTLTVGSEYSPPVDPTVVTVLILNWTNTSRISVDSNDNEEIQIFGRGIPIRISTTGRIETAANGIRLYSQASEDSNIRLYAGDYVRIRTNDYLNTPGRYEWEFQDNGSLRMPAGGIIREDVVTENPTIELTPANPEAASQKLVIKGGQEDNYHLHLTTGDLEETSVILGTDEHNVRTYPDGTIIISAYDYGAETPESKGWVYTPFGTSGQIIFPDGTFQTTAWAGGRVRTFAPGASTGTEGDKAGDLFFNDSYIYYCTADYTDGQANIWKRIAWSNDTWGS